MIDNINVSIISLIENNEIEKLNTFVQENVDEIEFNRDLYKLSLTDQNFCEVIKVLSDNDTRNREVVINDIFHLFENEWDEEETEIETDSEMKKNSIKNINNKKSIFIDNIKSGKIIINGLDDSFTNNLNSIEKIKVKIIEKVNENNIEELKNYIASNKILISYINTENFDILTYAIENNASIEMVEYLVSLYKSLDYIVKDNSPLKCAITKEDLPLVQLLVKNGADVNLKDDSYVNEKPLIYAINKGNDEIIKYLIEQGAEINGPPTGYGEIPLFTAIRNGNGDIVKFLIDHGADVNLSNKKNLSILTTAIQFGNENIVKCLIDNGADVDILTRNGLTPLTIGIKSGNENVVKYIVDHGADVNKKNGYNNTPLTLAIEKGNENVVKYLIDHGADVNMKGEIIHQEDESLTGNIIYASLVSGTVYTPLELAIKKRNSVIVEYLLNHGADANTTDMKMFTPLNLSIIYNDENVAKTLIKSGADINMKSRSWDDPPMILAIKKGNDAIVKCLIENNANLNVVDDTTALAAAIKYGKEDLAKFMIDHGADINLKGRNGYTPFITAILFERETLINYLIDKGVDINMKDDHGDTPLTNAINIGNENIVKILKDKGAK